MKISSDYIKEIIQNNRDNLAFVIGNGIHKQYKDCEISWEDLLKSLWVDFIGKQIEIPKGISYTEFYDILELVFFENNRGSLNLKSSELPRTTLKDFGKIKSEDLYNIMLKISQTPPTSNLKKYNSIDLFRNRHSELVSDCRKWCEENIENGSDLSDEMCVNLMIETLSNNTKVQYLRNSVKQAVARKFQSKDKYNLERCVNTISKLNAPILTTNFDTYISDAINAKQKKLTLQNNEYKFSDFYPWNVYYSDKEITNPLDGFAVWHINGTKNYPRSIRLGLSDYMGSVQYARKMIQGQSLNEYFSGKQQEFWVGYSTWLHIIFNKSLFIFGLGLEENEVFLRWLLIQRTKYCKMYKKSHKGWYIDKSIKAGKRFFLEQLGFEVIDLSDYNTLYHALETL